MSRLANLFACLLLAVFAAACGGGGDDEKAAAPAATATPTAAAGKVDVAAVSKNLKTKPAIAQPSGDPPSALQKTDVVKGRGRAAKAGDMVAVQYVGVSWSTGIEFDASWDRGAKPFSFPLGGGRVIAGWDQGVAGMKVGGRRVLVIPPDLAYGDRSPTPDIAPGETLVFVVDLMKIK
jgi:peptidylprolyl isomerase